MPRSKAKYHYQPDNYTCGPTSLKTALEILGKRYSLESLITLCKTTRNGTSVKNLIKAINKLRLSVLAVEWATLRHLQSTLKPIIGAPRAVIVNYQESDTVVAEDGHYATVAGFSSRLSRIYLFDTLKGGKKSYNWTEFIELWWDFDYKRKKGSKQNKTFKLARKYYNRLMLVITKKPEHLPVFKIPTQKSYIPN